MGLRPKRSEISPVNNKPIAKASVEKDKGKLLCVGEIWKKSANTGIMGCTQYNDEKEANPAKNKDHKIVFRVCENSWLSPFSTLYSNDQIKCFYLKAA